MSRSRYRPGRRLPPGGGCAQLRDRLRILDRATELEDGLREFDAHVVYMVPKRAGLAHWSRFDYRTGQACRDMENDAACAKPRRRRKRSWVFAPGNPCRFLAVRRARFRGGDLAGWWALSPTRGWCYVSHPTINRMEYLAPPPCVILNKRRQ